MRRVRAWLTFANVVSVTSLVFALGLGGAWAATELEKNEVKSKHIGKGQVKNADIADDAVTSPKVDDGSLLGEDFAAGQLPAGPTGDTGPQGPKGDTGSVDTSNFFTKGESDARFLGNGATATNSSLLGGLGPSAYVQGDGAKLLTNMLVEPNDGGTDTLFNVANVGKLSLQCTATNTNTLRLIYHNNSAAAQWRVAEKHDTQGVPNHFLSSQLVAANSDEASSFSYSGANLGLPFRDMISVVPQSGTGTSLLFEVSGVINPSGFGCLVHGTATVLP